MSDQDFVIDYVDDGDFELNPDGTPRTPGKSVEHLIRLSALKKQGFYKDWQELNVLSAVTDGIANVHKDEKFDVCYKAEEPIVQNTTTSDDSDKKPKKRQSKEGSTSISSTSSKKRKYEKRPMTTKKSDDKSSKQRVTKSVINLKNVKVEKSSSKTSLYKSKRVKKEVKSPKTTTKITSRVKPVVDPTWEQFMGSYPPPQIKPVNIIKDVPVVKIKEEIFDDYPSSTTNSNITTSRPPVTIPFVTPTQPFLGKFTIPKKSRNQTVVVDTIKIKKEPDVFDEWYDPYKLIKQEFQPPAPVAYQPERYVLPMGFPNLPIKIEQVEENEPPVMNIPSPEPPAYSSLITPVIKNEVDDENLKDEVVEHVEVKLENLEDPVIDSEYTPAVAAGTSYFPMVEPRSKFFREVPMEDGAVVKATFVGPKGVRFPDETNTQEIDDYHDNYQVYIARRLGELKTLAKENKHIYKNLKKRERPNNLYF